MAMQTGEQSRFTDLLNEPVDHLLSPIKVYQDKPLISLSEAVKPIEKRFREIEDYVFVASENCKNPAGGLTQDESSAIYLYTMQFDNGPSLYHLLNQSLRAEEREELKPWFSFLKLFLTALYKLPSQRETVWRGIRDIDLSSKYKTGTKFVWWGVSSCTTNIEVLESNQFLGNYGQRTLFSINCINGKSVAAHSYFKNKEEEIILMPGSYFEVVGQYKPSAELHIIQLKEIEPPIEFVKRPFERSINVDNSSIINTSNEHLQFSSQIITQTLSNSLTQINSNTKWIEDGITIFGRNGKGSGLHQLSYPQDIFIDNDERIYIADCGNHRIVSCKTDETNSQIIAGGNGKGDRMGQLNNPTDVIVDKENDFLIICDNENRRVVQWSQQNNTSRQIIISDIKCRGLTKDSNGYLYVSDTNKNEVRRWKIGDRLGTIVAGGNRRGNRLNQLHFPTHIFVDEDCSLYVSDSNNHRIMKWVKDAKEGVTVAGGQGQGNHLKQLSIPQGVIVDQSGNIYIADSNNNRVVCWQKGAVQGNIIVGGNGQGTQSNQFNGPFGLAFDRSGNLYVSDWKNHRIQKLNIDLN